MSFPPPTPYEYSQVNLIVDIWHPIPANVLRMIFLQWNRNFKITIHQKAFYSDGIYGVIIIGCLATVIGHEHNLIFSHRTATINQPLLRMVTLFYCITFLKLPYMYGIYYTVTLCVWFLVHSNHKNMVFSSKNMYAYGLCSHTGFPNLMPIPVLYPNYTGIGTNI